ncbi:hypothetical protein GFS60_00849 [Rhodococcus sp. WAY2]|nr:hypothetical protein GFS60_00849 [Rhodococcus sp. WAY2]
MSTPSATNVEFMTSCIGEQDPTSQVVTPRELIESCAKL